MNITTLREQLHQYLEKAGDEEILKIYDLLMEETNDSGVQVIDSLREELDFRYQAYKAGNITLISSRESNERIDKLIGLTGNKHEV